jgi:hypothetical protein
MARACSTIGGDHTKLCSENLNERDHFGNTGMDGRIILK